MEDQTIPKEVRLRAWVEEVFDNSGADYYFDEKRIYDFLKDCGECIEEVKKKSDYNYKYKWKYEDTCIPVWRCPVMEECFNKFGEFVETKTEGKVKGESLPKVVMPILSHMDNAERVKRLKEHLTLTKVKHEEVVMKLMSLKEAHIYCVIHGLSAQQYGPLLEKYIRTKFNYKKNKAEDCIGDCSKDGKNSEVKVSMGGATHTKFNFVQIRPSHDCDVYILTAYYLSSENVEVEGELYVFKVPKEEIKKIVMTYGGYAHGTIKEHGSISMESLNDEKSIKEYALRPTINDNCWKALLPHRVSESAL